MLIQLIRNVFKQGMWINVNCISDNMLPVIHCHWNISTLFVHITNMLLGYIQRTICINRSAYYSSSVQTEAIDNLDEPIDIKNPYKRENRQCLLCKLNIAPDYKNARLLSQFQSVYTGRIYGRHITGLCKTKQTQVERAIKFSQACGFMPGYHKAPEFFNDPKLYDPEKPIRPHPH